MAFTFTVEDGTGLATANSYVSVAEADDILYIEQREWKVWTLLEEPEKELALAGATRYLDDNYQWYGKKTSTTQALRWPRRGMRDVEGNCIADAIIPVELKRATARLAVWLLGQDGEEAMNFDGLKRFRSDEIEIEWQSNFSAKTAPDFLAKNLISFGTGPNDRGFKKIIPQ